MTLTETPELNKDGLVKHSPATIFLYNGGTIEPLNPDPDDINIVDIAHALSNLCRWTGHVKKFCSVAEHCVHVSKMVPMEERLAALLHDASEAYLADLARPIKQAPGLGEKYLEVEFKLEQVIATKFNLAPPPMSANIKAADNGMLFREAEILIPHLGKFMPKPDKGTPHVQCWLPAEAEQRFLEAFEKYGGKYD